MLDYWLLDWIYFPNKPRRFAEATMNTKQPDAEQECCPMSDGFGETSCILPAGHSGKHQFKTVPMRGPSLREAHLGIPIKESTLALIKKKAEVPTNYEACKDSGWGYSPADNDNADDAHSDGVDDGEIYFARTILDMEGVEYKKP
jgi:hypothetical protein